ncbi:hypothetical protein KGD82_05870 [Nocardiopsis eucommiae]|uniref:Uncharacterized protein n=1 Tax=Nocardiopsis eucommiae TaxID=2831970 RepID=A0A975LBM8_9ACTN|nr:hypothetical protein KGD82_05870 [Nocardiopsis eucommiae]
MNPAIWRRVTEDRGSLLDLRKLRTEGINTITLRGFRSHGPSALDIM